MIANGKKVAWTYQAGGVEFSQEGKILAFVGAGVSAIDSLTEFDAEATSRQKKFSDTSSNDRYLIAVKNEHGIMNYYTPTVGVVDKQNPKAVKAYEKENATTDSAQGSNAPTNTTPTMTTPTMMEVKAGVKAGRAPAINSEFTMGNSTMYRICATDGNGGFVGYRLFGGNYKLKFLVSVGGYDWTYHSMVREAYSGFCRATDSKGNSILENLNIPECNKFASSIEAQLKAMGFKNATVDMLLTDLLTKTSPVDTRRNVSAVFLKNKY